MKKSRCNEEKIKSHPGHAFMGGGDNPLMGGPHIGQPCHKDKVRLNELWFKIEDWIWWLPLGFYFLSDEGVFSISDVHLILLTLLHISLAINSEKNHPSKILGRGRLNRYSGTFHWKRNEIIVIAVYYCAFFLFQIFGWDESFSALVMHCLGAQAKKLHKEAILQQPILEVSHKRVFWKLDIKISQSNDKKDKCPSKIGYFLAWAIDSYSFSVIIDHRVIECWHTYYKNISLQFDWFIHFPVGKTE